MLEELINWLNRLFEPKYVSGNYYRDQEFSIMIKRDKNGEIY